MTRLEVSTGKLLPALDGFRVEIDEKEARADIVLDRPPFNYISPIQRDQLRTVFDLLDSEPAVRVIVLRSAGEHFSSGGVPRAVADASIDWNMDAPSRCSKPVISANRGYCFGAAFDLSLACDFRIATETTLYGLPVQKEGQFAASARLLKMVGLGRTKDIVMRSRHIPGTQAYDWGIATEFVVDSELENVTDALVRELCSVSPAAQCATKKLLNEKDDGSRPDGNRSSECDLRNKPGPIKFRKEGDAINLARLTFLRKRGGLML